MEYRTFFRNIKRRELTKIKLNNNISNNYLDKEKQN